MRAYTQVLVIPATEHDSAHGVRRQTVQQLVNGKRLVVAVATAAAVDFVCERLELVENVLLERQAML